MHGKRISAALATAAVASIAVIGVVSPASADPASGYPPYAGTGSDTTQDVLNRLANSGTLVNVGSWDAFGSATIKVTATGPTFNRPAGSGNGIKALSASIQNTAFQGTVIGGELDFARSSRGPASKTTTVSASDLTFIPFARDAVSYSTNNSTSLGALTTAQLAQVYSANSAADLVVTVGGVAVTVHPILPQAGSGTRAFFLQAIGVTTVGTQVQQGVNENDASVLTVANSVVPFSAAAWIAQKNGVSANTTAGAVIGNLDGVSPVAASGTSLVPNAAYYASTTLGRDVYNVIGTSRLIANTDADKEFITDFAGPNAKVRSAAAQSIISTFGFRPVLYAGDTDLTGTDVTGWTGKALGGLFE